jgi:hypothetical protein
MDQYNKLASKTPINLSQAHCEAYEAAKNTNVSTDSNNSFPIVLQADVEDMADLLDFLEDHIPDLQSQGKKNFHIKMHLDTLGKLLNNPFFAEEDMQATLMTPLGYFDVEYDDSPIMHIKLVSE